MSSTFLSYSILWLHVSKKIQYVVSRSNFLLSRYLLNVVYPRRFTQFSLQCYQGSEKYICWMHREMVYRGAKTFIELGFSGIQENLLPLFHFYDIRHTRTYEIYEYVFHNDESCISDRVWRINILRLAHGLFTTFNLDICWLLLLDMMCFKIEIM